MSNIERRRRDEALDVPSAARIVPSLRDQREQHLLTWADARQDHRQESSHIVTMREMERQAVEGAGAAARDAFILIAETQAARRYVTEVKYELERAHKESQILAGDDLEMAAKFAALDDDLYHFVRSQGLR